MNKRQRKKKIRALWAWYATEKIPMAFKKRRWRNLWISAMTRASIGQERKVKK